MSGGRGEAPTTWCEGSGEGEGDCSPPSCGRVPARARARVVLHLLVGGFGRGRGGFATCGTVLPVM
eukprot:6189043-Prymnesium_polylepis.1